MSGLIEPIEIGLLAIEAARAGRYFRDRLAERRQRRLARAAAVEQVTNAIRAGLVDVAVEVGGRRP
ncbi:MAG: hypothetical protein AAGA90_00775 [Actinomycetota bacterium]